MTAPDDASPNAGFAPEPLPGLNGAARFTHTPCGDGSMVWRSWGEGPALVLLHGGSGSWRHWARTIPALAERRRVIAADIPGLGDSALPPAPYSPESVAAIVAAGLEQVLAPGETYDLAGFSFGALISGQVALLHGTRLRTLNLVGMASLGVPRAQIALEKVRLMAGEARAAAHRTNLERLMFADPSRIDDVAVAIQDRNTRDARLRSPAFAHTTHSRDAVRVVPTRVGAIWGEADATAVPSLRVRLDILREARPDTAVHVIPGAGHWVMYEAADAFNAALEGLLA